MSPDGLALIGPLALAALRQSSWQVDAIGGLTLGADPISYAIAYASASSDAPLRAFTVRKEAKAHGTGRLIEPATVVVRQSKRSSSSTSGQSGESTSRERGP